MTNTTSDSKSTDNAITDNAITEAGRSVSAYVDTLSQISTKPSLERVIDVTSEAAMNILMTALERRPTLTGSDTANRALGEAISAAALQARNALHPAAHCNVEAMGPDRRPGEAPEEWMHRAAPTLQATCRTVRDVFKGMLMGCTASFGRSECEREARQQAVRITTHVSTVIDVAANTDAIIERMPVVPATPETN